MSEQAKKPYRPLGCVLLLLGSIFLLPAVLEFAISDGREQQGGSGRMSRRAAMFLETFGKKGTMMILGGAGLICWAVGVWILVQSLDPGRDPKEHEGRPGLGAAKPGKADPGSARCPMCSGEIRAGAAFCRHCREWLS